MPNRNNQARERKKQTTRSNASRWEEENSNARNSSSITSISHIAEEADDGAKMRVCGRTQHSDTPRGEGGAHFMGNFTFSVFQASPAPAALLIIWSDVIIIIIIIINGTNQRLLLNHFSTSSCIPSSEKDRVRLCVCS